MAIIGNEIIYGSSKPLYEKTSLLPGEKQAGPLDLFESIFTDSDTGVDYTKSALTFIQG